MLLLLVALLPLGCGESSTEVISLPAPQLTAIGLDGEQTSIPADSLYEPTTGQPTVRSVLVIDRHSNRKAFIDVDQLPPESQVDARYILLTRSPETGE